MKQQDRICGTAILLGFACLAFGVFAYEWKLGMVVLGILMVVVGILVSIADATKK